MMNKNQIATAYFELAKYICNALSEIDGLSTFVPDKWEREAGGGGVTHTLENGRIIEKGGVAFSAVHGEVSEAMKKNLNMKGEQFFATGVSIVLHSRHPRHPIIHMNVRYFELDENTWWFGGGIDLTPHFIREQDAICFHQELKKYCDAFDSTFYPRFKPWADEYFFQPHRGESRGVGGIFFDHIGAESGHSRAELFHFCEGLGRLFPIVYGQQIEANPIVSQPSDEELLWQQIRRSRYVEFNLLHDRGTKFGIYSGGRTESILLSMPPQASWRYCFEPEPTSEEGITLNFLRNPPDWISLK
jgi:coproporphyrinogen III oxidase